MRRALPFPLPLAAALAAAVRIASAGNVAADILDTIALGADSLGTETTAALAVECDAAVAGGLAVVGDAVFSNGIARVAPGGGLDAANPDLAWSGREPAWWTDYGVLNGEPPNDEAAATAGQLKWIASRARAMLDDAAWSAGGAGAAVSNLVETLPPGSNSLAVAAAELKRIARPFAQRCVELNIDCAFSTATAVSAALAPGPRDGEIVTVGQIKRLFDFDPSIDADANAIPDWWERLHGVFDPDPPGGAPDPDRDSDGDGLSDAAEFALGTDPVSPDTDGDGLSDADELASGTNPLDPDTDGDGLPDGEETPRILRDADIPWFVLSNALVVASGSWDDKAFSFGVDPVRLGGLLCTNLAADSNGRVFFRDAFHASSVSSSRQNATSSNAVFHSVHACVAAYWTDLCLRSELGSKIRTGTHGPFRVVQYEDVGFRANATNRVSFQLAAASNAVFATYAAIEDARPDKTTTFAAQGPGANPNLWYGVGAPTLPLAGRTIGYHFGTGSSPFLADTDGDGVPDGTEVALGLHPGRADTDRDGLPDAWELAVGLDPLDSTGDDGGSGDPDGDGRTNAQELSAGTDPFLADTDGDGIPDGSSASSWNNHSLWGAVRHETNLVIVASASVPTNASACLRIDSLALPIIDGESVFALFLPTGQIKNFTLRCTRGASVSLLPLPAAPAPRLRSPPDPLPPWTDSGVVFLLDDPAGAFSGEPATRAGGHLGYPRFTIAPASGTTDVPCVHGDPGTAYYDVSSVPSSASSLLGAAEIVHDFVREDLDTFSLTPNPLPTSIKTGIVRIPAASPDFEDLHLGAMVHRCQGTDHSLCDLCGPVNLAPDIIDSGDRFRLVNSPNRAAFSLATNCAQEAVWTVEPATIGAPFLHSAAAGGSSGRTLRTTSGTVWARAGSAPGVYTIRATHPDCSQSTATATFTVGKVQLEAVRFNWDFDAATNDAINLRGGPKTNEVFDLSVGEWIRGGQNLPACYVTNVSPVLRARFTIHPASLSNCTVHAAGGPFGGVLSTNLSFSGGDSGFVPLAAVGNTGDTVGRARFDLDWMATGLEGDSFPAERVVKTHNHVLYTIFREPLSPWKKTPFGDDQNAWTNALEFALVTAGAAGSDSETNALAAITQHLFSGHGLVYDTAEGKSTYLTNSTFRLSAYMEKSGNSDTNRAGNIVNCYDQACAVSILGQLLGLDAEVIFLHPFGYINPINLVGIGQCNNPFFSSTNAVVNTPMASPDDIRREYFSNHMYVLFDGTVFDACAGPSLGTQTHATYLSTVVDTSTSSERSPSWASPKQCGSETNHINFGHIPEVK